jgi:two-component system, chemotaxis family, protein-glutamate methylesterase/glutaminase
VISVLVVEDSVVVRRMIVDALATEPGIEVVGTAANGKIALSKVDQLKPDIVTLDIEMPIMDGLEALRELRKTHPRLPVIMFSTLTQRGAAATLDALAAGASDYVTKPANVGSVTTSTITIREQLVPRIHVLGGKGKAAPQRNVGLPARPTTPPPTAVRLAASGPAPRVIAIGASTGGPDALARLLAVIPAGLPVPILVVQHMPPVFTKMFAERLDRQSPLRVVEAQDGVPVEPGVVYIAPGERHMLVVPRGNAVVTRLNDAPPENSCRPAVDVLFRSVARIYGRSALATVLTGMGQDGRRGGAELREAGAEVVAQDEASSVVWGMPGAIVNNGLASAVLPLDQIAPYLISRVVPSRSSRPKVVA